jgi:hypothetical protein
MEARGGPVWSTSERGSDPMPQPKNIRVTITQNPQPAPVGGAISPVVISVDEDPVDLVDVDEGNGVDNPNAHINWKISGHGWTFTSNGVAVERAHGKFTDKGNPGGDKKHHRWQRDRKEAATDPDHRHKYTITVTDGTTTVSWDPWVINR